MNAENSDEVDSDEEVRDASRDGFVSIWLAAETTEEEIDDYLAEVEDFDPETDNEEPFSDFANEFGLLWYDSEHSMEAAFERTPVSVEILLGGAFFSESFLTEAKAAAAKEGFGPVQAAIMLYDVAYEPEHGAAAGVRFRFLGAFPYKTDDETDVE